MITSGDYVTYGNSAYYRYSGSCTAPSNILGTISDYLELFSPGASGFNCSGITYSSTTACSGRVANYYYTFTNQQSSPGNWGDNSEPILPTGNYSYKRT